MGKDQLIATNSFTGMNQDTLSSLTDFKQYRYARNAIRSSRDNKGFGLTNEGSTVECGNVGSNVVGTSYCEERNWTVFFTANDGISILRHGDCEVVEVMNAGEFGCSFGFSECEWVGKNVQFKTMDPCNELHVYFTAGCEIYKVNIDLMLDPDRKEGLKKELGCSTKCGLRNNCEYFKVMKMACAPKITPKAFQEGGGQLGAGAYTFVARMIHTDGGETNWFHFSDPVFVGSEHNIAGEQSTGHIEVTLSCLDCKFSKLELAVIENIGGIITAKTLGFINYNNNHYSYRYNGTQGTPIDLKELLVKEHVYLQAKHIEQKDGHMLYYGIKSRKNLHWQPKVNQFQTEYVVWEMPYEHAKKHNIRSLMRDETYAIGAVANYIDGSHSKVFHIPATPAGGGNTGNQESIVSENFVDAVNSNSNLSSKSTKGSSGGNVGQGISTIFDIICEYEDINEQVDINFIANKNTGQKDTIEFYLLGNGSLTNIFDCIKECIEGDEKVMVYVTSYEDDKIDFHATDVVSSTASSLVISGHYKGKSVPSKEAKSIIVAHVLNTSGGGGGGGGEYAGGSGGGGGQSQGTVTTAEITRPQEVERKRSPIPDIVNNPQNDHYDELVKKLVDSMDTDAKRDQCEEILLWEEQLKAQCCNCKEGSEEFPPELFNCNDDSCAAAAPFVCCPSGGPCPGGSAYERCIADIDDPDNQVAEWENLLQWYNVDELTPEYTADSIRVGARELIADIKKRERLERKKREFSVSKSASYGGGGVSGATAGVQTCDAGTNFSGPIFDCCGSNETEVDMVEVSSGRTIPDFETNILYPCTTDCNGDFIYGGLAGKPVAHHKMPDCSQEPHFVSKAVGVPYGKYWTDAGETSDLYVRIMGLRITNIQLPTEDELPLPLCPHNPYSIVMVKRTDDNRKVVLKGLATGTFVINNNGKTYDHPRYGCNSMEEVSYYHDDGEGGRLSNGGSGTTHTLYSLDGMTIKPALHATVCKEELRLRGAGERYGLYAKGKEPDDTMNGSRIDALGARQSINLNEWQGGGGESELVFKKYAPGDEAVAPGAGGSRPLMNRSGQPCIFFQAGLAQLTDRSFTGDVLEHNAPIPEALGQYVSFKREMDNQYGNLENLNYMPILHAGRNHNTSIQGLCGDVYIGPYSFVKTGFVSDKVGKCDPAERFNIPAQVPTKKEKRCICDGPEDVIHQMNGAWVWTELPEDGDAADPKNWAGTHTHGLSHTDTYQEAVGTAPVSDFYYPGTTTTNITYIGEFETCPWLREKSDLLEKSWYAEGLNRAKWRFDSGISVDGNTNGWEDAYLNQFHREIEQPSRRQKLIKTSIRTFINIAMPLMGVDNIFDAANGGIDFVGNLVEYPFLAIIWWLLVQVLFRNDMLDKLLGIPICKSDETDGFKEGYNKGLFFNPTGYNIDYSTVSDFYSYEGLPDPYYVCDCDDCFDKSGETSNEIYISDRQIQGSPFDAYTHIRPLSKIHIPANYGKLTNLATVDGTLYAHTTDALIAIRHNRTLVNTDSGNIILGSSGFLSEPEGLTEGIVEGYAGLLRHNEHINTQYGYFFVDGDADIVYRLSSKGLEPISTTGMFNFFKEKLLFCSRNECVGEQKPGTPYYALGVDPRHNRFLLTKSDTNSNHNFTLSYDFETQTWISFHDYIPRDYIWDRRDMYSLAPGGGIWKHNQDCNYQTFYGKYYPHEIEFTTTSPDVDTFNWVSTIINTEAEVCSGCSWVEDLDRTFNKIAVYNSTQGTGTQTLLWISDNEGAFEDANQLILDKSGVIKAHKKRRMWQINEIKDFRRLDCSDLPMTLCEKCEPIHKINEGIFDCSVLNKQDFRNKVLSDKYIVYRLIYDYDDSTKINTIYVKTNGIPNQT